MSGQQIFSSVYFPLLLLLLIVPQIATAVVVEQREENVSLKKNLAKSKTKPMLELDTNNNDRKWPIVPDPVFPKRPHEFQKLVDKSCQAAIYVGTKSWRVASDSGFIKALGGCKQVSRGFCQGRSTPDDMMFWKRSQTGLWAFQGPTREYRKNCTKPAHQLDEILQPSWKSRLFTVVAEDIKKMVNKTHKYFKSLLKLMGASSSIIIDNKPLPRIADLQLPALWPEEFAQKYPEECRFLRADWDVNYRHTPAKEFYKNCNFTVDSYPYCMMAEQREGDSLIQPMLLRSVSGGYENGGFLQKESVQIGCTWR